MQTYEELLKDNDVRRRQDISNTHYKPAQRGIICGASLRAHARYKKSDCHDLFVLKTKTDIDRVTCRECLMEILQLAKSKLNNQ